MEEYNIIQSYKHRSIHTHTHTHTHRQSYVYTINSHKSKRQTKEAVQLVCYLPS